MNLDQLSLSAALLEPDDISAPTMAWLGHIPFAAWLVFSLRPDTLVELGTHYADSYFAFCKSVKAHGLNTRCYAVDTWAGDPHAGVYGEEVYNRVRHHHDQHYAGFSRLLRMRFDEALQHFSDGSVDLLHIDGLHTYEAVREDFTTWLPRLSDKAVVLFHDTAVREGDFGVWRFWEEISAQYPHLNFQHSHGLGVLFVGQNQPEPVQALIDAWADSSQRHALAALFATLGDRLLLGWRYRQQERQLEQRKAKILGLEQAVIERDARIEELQGETGRLAHALAQQREENALMCNSLSWRITEPLRAVRAKLRG